MFVFNSCCSNHGNDPISFPDHSFLHFPSPFDDDDANSLILQQQPQQQHDILLQHLPLNEPPSTFLNALGSESTRILVNNDDHQNLIMEQQMMQRKRVSSKRDRHSKINTLRGPRDRRMRLSLPVAREFFGLQDMLGVDKASKTVEWLLFQARHAIKKLSTRDQQSCHRDTRSSPSSVSDDGEEVVSGIDETTAVIVINNTKEGRKATKKEKRGRVARKTAFRPLAREGREKARARARARTREKQLQIRQKMLSDPNPIEQMEGTTTTKQDLSKISPSSWSTQMETTGEESGGTTKQIDQQLRTRNQGIIDYDDPAADDCLMIMGRWSPSNSIYNSLQNNNNGSPQEHPFGDFQFFGKPWEPYNNHGIC